MGLRVDGLLDVASPEALEVHDGLVGDSLDILRGEGVAEVQVLLPVLGGLRDLEAHAQHWPVMATVLGARLAVLHLAQVDVKLIGKQFLATGETEAVLGLLFELFHFFCFLKVTTVVPLTLTGTGGTIPPYSLPVGVRGCTSRVDTYNSFFL